MMIFPRKVPVDTKKAFLTTPLKTLNESTHALRSMSEKRENSQNTSEKFVSP